MCHASVCVAECKPYDVAACTHLEQHVRATTDAVRQARHHSQQLRSARMVQGDGAMKKGTVQLS